MTNSTWTADFLAQLTDAWNKNAHEGIADAQLSIDAVSGFLFAVELAAAKTDDEILDVTSKHLAVTAGGDGARDTSNVLHAALLNVAVTFLRPALDALMGSEQDVRAVAQQMRSVVILTEDD